MIEIDDSEAGGQILRTATGLSALTERPFKIKNIRGARPNPGLKVQHMEGIKAVADICNAEIEGLYKGSKELAFVPKDYEPKDLIVNLKTAGSIGLVLQTLLIALIKSRKTVKVKFHGGGTWGKWAPPVEYISRVFLPLIGHRADFNVIRDGFYPKGGAEVDVKIFPFELKEIEILKKGPRIKSYIVSIASESLRERKVAERQAESAKNNLQSVLKDPEIEIIYRESDSPGSGILVYSINKNSIIGSDAIGEREKSAEKVGKDTAKNFLIEYKTAVDRHAADMLLPYIALYGKGKIKSIITQHVLTNANVIEKFLDVKFKIEGKKGEMGTIELE